MVAGNAHTLSGSRWWLLSSPAELAQLLAGKLRFARARPPTNPGSGQGPKRGFQTSGFSVAAQLGFTPSTQRMVFQQQKIAKMNQKGVSTFQPTSAPCAIVAAPLQGRSVIAARDGDNGELRAISWLISLRSPLDDGSKKLSYPGGQPNHARGAELRYSFGKQRMDGDAHARDIGPKSAQDWGLLKAATREFRERDGHLVKPGTGNSPARGLFVRSTLHFRRFTLPVRGAGQSTFKFLPWQA